MWNLWLLKKLGLKVGTTSKNDRHIDNGAKKVSATNIFLKKKLTTCFYQLNEQNIKV